MALAGMELLLLCAALATPAAATPSWCFARLEEPDGGGACSEPLLEEPLPLADCCLNPAHGFRLRPRGLCRPCRPEQWGPWSPWGPCSVTCGEGTQLRGRAQGPPGGHPGDTGGDPGDGREWQLRACENQCCPEPGAWSDWSPWSACSVTCGAGLEGRGRSCSDPAPRCGGGCGGGPARESRECGGGNPPCPVGGAWGPWGPWGGCSATCRGGGPGPTRSRSRRCDSPPPSRDPPGPPCQGRGEETQECPSPPCP
ncbi:properdin, partial [Aegotheles albertisi]